MELTIATYNIYQLSYTYLNYDFQRDRVNDVSGSGVPHCLGSSVIEA